MSALAKAARSTGRHGQRNETLILLACRHGLRASELLSLRWERVDLEAGLVHLSRPEDGTGSTRPLGSAEKRALQRLRRDSPGAPYVFVGDRDGPLTTATIHRIVAHAGRLAGFPFLVHPHLLRDSSGNEAAGSGRPAARPSSASVRRPQGR